jgi:hypothetical protein
MAGLCGCSQPCTCELNVGPVDLISITGSGDPLAGGWIVTVVETPLTILNTDGAIDITAGGSYGHVPTINLVIDPDSTAIVTTSPAGLRVDIDPSNLEATAVADTNSVDLTLTGTTITADVIPHPDRGLEILPSGLAIRLQDDPAAAAAVCENRLRFTTAGDLTMLPDGLFTASVGAGTQRSLPVTLGDDSSNALNTSFTNSRDCQVYATFRCIAFLEAEPSNYTTPPAGGRIVSMQARADSGGATTGALIGAIGTWSMTHMDSIASLAAGTKVRFRAQLETTFLLDPGEVADIDVYVTALEDLSGYTSATPDSGFDTEAAAWFVDTRRQ